MSLRERALLARLRERDEEAFSEMVRENQARIFGLLYRMIGNREEAEDLAQEVFITVFKSIEQFRGESKFSTWLYRIAANHCKNRIQHLARRRAVGGLDEESHYGKDALKDDGASPHALLEGRETGKLVQEAVASLDEDQRLVLVLRDLEELSYQEITEITGLNEGTVKSRLHRARMRIKEILSRGRSGA